MGVAPTPHIPLYVHWVGITLEIVGKVNEDVWKSTPLGGEISGVALIHLTMEFIFTPIPISVRQWRQFSHGSPAGTGNITFPRGMKPDGNKK